MNGAKTAIILAVTILIISCGTTRQSGPVNENWLDDNTYRITASATIQPNHQTLPWPTRQTLACNAAVLMAQSRMLEKFADIGISNISGTVDTGTIRDSVKRYWSGTIRGGDVRSKRFNRETNVCEAVYTLTVYDLRRKVRQSGRIAMEKRAVKESP